MQIHNKLPSHWVTMINIAKLCRNLQKYKIIEKDARLNWHLEQATHPPPTPTYLPSPASHKTHTRLWDIGITKSDCDGSLSQNSPPSWLQFVWFIEANIYAFILLLGFSELLSSDQHTIVQPITNNAHSVHSSLVFTVYN